MVTGTQIRHSFIIAATLGLVAACTGCTSVTTTNSAPVSEGVAEAAAESIHNSTSHPDIGEHDLKKIVAARSAEDRARDDARHPAQTLEFFGLQPGMKVAEVLPGGGWYSKIIAQYVGHDGAIYGVNYQDRLWAQFGWSEERVARSIGSTATFADNAQEWAGFAIPAQGFTFANVPEDLNGQVDAVLFIRALHNLQRFNSVGVLDEALTNAFAMLKPGGVLGVVQHRAPETASEEWASGSNGYLKVSNVVRRMEAVGLVFEAASEINANPKDQPTEDDFVWRLPPANSGAKDDATKAAMAAIGESDRMTLRFRKPL